jgi:hemerythrin-like metal-binding protein
MIPIPELENRYLLGVEAMDVTHREFVDLVNALGASGQTRFAELFTELVAHTRAHFAAEEEMMERSGFPSTAEHRSEHARVLGEMERFVDSLARGRSRLARSYVTEQIPEWFALHAATMDSALAAHLKGSTRSAAAVAPPFLVVDRPAASHCPRRGDEAAFRGPPWSLYRQPGPDSATFRPRANRDGFPIHIQP